MRNYASRLIGSQLILYAPFPLNLWHIDLAARLPAMRRWHPAAKPADFKRIADATRIYRTDQALNPQEGITLHSIVRCDFAQPEVDCRSSAVLGPAGWAFYVSSRAVYGWTTSNQRDAGSGRSGGNLSLLRVAVRDFGDGQTQAPPQA